MKLRMYRQEDCKEVAELFYHTVHTINEKDYTKEQLDVCPCKYQNKGAATVDCAGTAGESVGKYSHPCIHYGKAFF